MKPSSIRYYFTEAFSGLFKNRLMTLASIATVAACLFIMTFSYCVVSNLQYMLNQLEDTIGIAIFLEKDMTAADIEEMKTTLTTMEHVKNVQFISPADALEDLKEDMDITDGLLDGFEGENNPLSNSFTISLDNIRNQDAVLQKLNQLDGISSIRHAKTETEILVNLHNAFQTGGIFVFVVLGIISVAIIINTIKISVYTRRTEINIMKYVGATDWFIRWPFIIEGVLIGLFGALVPMLISWPLYGKAVSLIYSNLPILQDTVSFRLTGEIFSVLLPVAFAFGIGLGVVGSISSIRKYLRV